MRAAGGLLRSLADKCVYRPAEASAPAAGGDEKSRKQRMKEMREAKVAAIRQEHIDAVRKREEKLRPEAVRVAGYFFF